MIHYYAYIPTKCIKSYVLADDKHSIIKVDLNFDVFKANLHNTILQMVSSFNTSYATNMTYIILLAWTKASANEKQSMFYFVFSEYILLNNYINYPEADGQLKCKINVIYLRNFFSSKKLNVCYELFKRTNYNFDFFDGASITVRKNSHRIHDHVKTPVAILTDKEFIETNAKSLSIILRRRLPIDLFKLIITFLKKHYGY